jgi:hypothetical protein
MSLLEPRARAKRIQVGLAVLAAAAACTTAAATPAAKPSSKALLPAHCPSVKLVRSTLGVKVNTVSTYTSELEYPYGSTALPVKRAPAYQRTCVYAANGTYNGQIVPATISFAAVVTRKDFASARANAAKSLAPFTVRGLGDAAWGTHAPKLDPRAGSSLFVLKGSLDIVLTAPNQAKLAELVTLARKLL